MSHLHHNSKPLVTRIRRMRGQLEAVERSILGEGECGAVLQQLAAVRGALNGLILQLMEDHLREHASPGLDDAELAPVIQVLRSYLK
jgi:DNA-binding FrmR family transcriptional regulator